MRQRIPVVKVLWSEFIALEVSVIINALLYMLLFVNRIIRSDILLPNSSPLYLTHVLLITAIPSLIIVIIALLMNGLKVHSKKNIGIASYTLWLILAIITLVYGSIITTAYAATVIAFLFVLSTLQFIFLGRTLSGNGKAFNDETSIHLTDQA